MELLIHTCTSRPYSAGNIPDMVDLGFDGRSSPVGAEVNIMSEWRAAQRWPTSEFPAFIIGGRGCCRGLGYEPTPLSLKNRPA